MAKYGLNKLKVLVVEKHMMMRRIVCDILRELGISQVRDSSDAAEAFEIFQNFEADLVLTDWSPGLNGVEFLQMLRRNPASRDMYVPVVMITAFTECQHVYAARDAGINEYLAKPITAKLIYSRIKSIIENPRLFVRNDDYFGPDRRRRRVEFAGPDRRAHANRGGGERRRKQAPIPFPERRGKRQPDRRGDGRPQAPAA
jgi:DNA-binding response OmpR family regulator